MSGPVASDPSRQRSGMTTKEHIVRSLQMTGRATVGELAEQCGVSDAAMRQHLDQLDADGLVTREQGEATPNRGRPPSYWTLAGATSARLHTSFPNVFPDRHADLTGEIITAIRESLGEAALTTVLEHRSRRQIDEYRTTLTAGGPKNTSGPNDTSGPNNTLGSIVANLAEIRDAEGYRAESIDNGDGSFSLVEHHCAIDAAAKSCGALCDSEMKVFTRVLDRTAGSKVTIRRVEHLAAGDACCRYEIRPR